MATAKASRLLLEVPPVVPRPMPWEQISVKALARQKAQQRPALSEKRSVR